MSWTSFDGGASIGQRGSEDGIIIHDEKHVDGARITLERDASTAPFSITCGIYGWMVHTCFFRGRKEAESECEQMKEELSNILNLIPWADDRDAERKLDPVSDEIRKFVERHW